MRRMISTDTSEVKSFLKSYRIMQSEIDITRDEISNLRALAYGTSRPVSSDGAQSGNSSDFVGRCAAKIADLQIHLEDEISAAVHRQQQVKRLILTIDDPVKVEVLLRRYLTGQKIIDIADTLSYSERHITRLLNGSYQELAVTYAQWKESGRKEREQRTAS